MRILDRVSKTDFLNKLKSVNINIACDLIIASNVYNGSNEELTYNFFWMNLMGDYESTGSFTEREIKDLLE